MSERIWGFAVKRAIQIDAYYTTATATTTAPAASASATAAFLKLFNIYSDYVMLLGNNVLQLFFKLKCNAAGIVLEREKVKSQWHVSTAWQIF